MLTKPRAKFEPFCKFPKHSEGQLPKLLIGDCISSSIFQGHHDSRSCFASLDSGLFKVRNDTWSLKGSTLYHSACSGGLKILGQTWTGELWAVCASTHQYSDHLTLKFRFWQCQPSKLWAQIISNKVLFSTKYIQLSLWKTQKF